MGLLSASVFLEFNDLQKPFVLLFVLLSWLANRFK